MYATIIEHEHIWNQKQNIDHKSKLLTTLIHLPPVTFNKNESKKSKNLNIRLQKIFLKVKKFYFILIT